MDADPRLIARRLAQELLHTPDPADTPALINALAHVAARLENDGDRALQHGILDALLQSPSGMVADALWSAWYETRQPDLLVFLIDNKLTAAQPRRLTALSLLKMQQPEVIDSWWRMPGGGQEWVEPLLALCSDTDLTVSFGARYALENLPKESVAARDEICRWAVEYNHVWARQIALRAGYAPSQPELRALFYLLTGQFLAYQNLDFDYHMLAAVLHAADDPMRRQIAEAARQAGWTGFVEAAAGGRSPRRLSQLSRAEWEVILALLNREGRWSELWRLAQSAPPTWSAHLLRSLQDNAWTPGQPELIDVVHRLSQAAVHALHCGAPARTLARYQSVLAGHRRRITALAATRRYIASGSADHTIRLWRLPQGQPVLVLDGHTSFVLSLAAAPTPTLQEGASDWLASGSADRSVRVWRIPADGVPETVLTLGSHSAEVAWLAYTPDGALLVSADARSINLWRMPDGQLQRSIKGIFTQLTSLGLSPDGRTLLALDSDRTLRLFSLPDGGLHKTLLEPVVGWAVSARGLLATSSTIGAIRLWSLALGESLGLLPGRVNSPHLTFDSSAAWLACADGKSIRLWPIPEPGQPMPEKSHLLEGHKLLISCLAAGPHGGLLASGGQDHILRVWQLPQAGARLGTTALEGHAAAIHHLAFAPSGMLASADDQTIRLWALDDLAAFLASPPGSLSPADLNAWETRLPGLEPTGPEYAWLAFALELARWQQRFDIEVQDAPPSIPVGNFDIYEIEIE